MNTEQPAVVRYGYVSDYSPQTHSARVVFPDKDNLVSDWLPVLVKNSLRDKEESPLAINEHVACLMSGNGIESGVIIGSLYDKTNTPAIKDESIHSFTFQDGSVIKYDGQTKTLILSLAGNIEVAANDTINLTGGETLSISGNGAKINFGSKSMKLDADNDFHVKTEGVLTLEASKIKLIGKVED